jgi:hypothetical protein
LSILREESSGALQAAGRRGRLTVDQRIAIASKVAAVTQLGNRLAVQTGTEANGVAPEDVTLADLAGGTENATDDVPVSEEALREVFNSGLSSAGGTGLQNGAGPNGPVRNALNCVSICIICRGRSPVLWVRRRALRATSSNRLQCEEAQVQSQCERVLC